MVRQLSTRARRWAVETTRTLLIAGALGGASMLVGCGSSSPTPTPAEVKPVATQAFVHVLDAQSEKLSSFEVVPATGQLTLRGSITAPSPTVFTADPKGRLLFVGGGGGAGAAYVAPYVATYALERGVPVQRETLPLTGSSTRPPHGIGAFDQELFVANTWHDGGTYHSHWGGTLRSMRLEEAAGRLSTAGLLSRNWDTGDIAVDPGWRIVYWLAEDIGATAFQLNADGSLRQIARGGLDEGGRAAAVAAGGKIFITSESGDLASFVVDGEASMLRLRTWMRDASKRGSLPGIALSGSGLLAVSADAIRTYSTSESGELTLVETSAGSFSSVAFHPSGAFLYASGNGLLRTYAVSSEGRLTMFDELPHPAGRLVVTSPPSPGM